MNGGQSMKRLLLLILVISLIACLSGCGSSSPTNNNSGKKKDITVVFVPKLTGNAFFEAANDGAQAYAKKHGFNVKYSGSPVASVENQTAIIKEAIKDKADALCISSLDATALDKVMKEAMAAGIKVTTWDSDVSGDARSIMVSQGTPEQLGRMLVEMAAKSLTSRGKNVSTDKVKYAWHYSQAIVADQNSWRVAGESYIKSAYPNWENVAPDNYYSEQDAQKAVIVGEQVFVEHPDIDLIICNDSTSLPGQAMAAQNRKLTAKDVTITGFASPNAMRQYCKDGIVERWGLWDCGTQGALGCYLAYSLASGKQLSVGSKVDVPEIGIVTIMPNTVLQPDAYTASNSGVVLMPSRTEFTIGNVDNYNF